jgi:hypothetical protein
MESTVKRARACQKSLLQDAALWRRKIRKGQTVAMQWCDVQEEACNVQEIINGGNDGGEKERKKERIEEIRGR